MVILKNTINPIYKLGVLLLWADILALCWKGGETDGLPGQQINDESFGLSGPDVEVIIHHRPFFIYNDHPGSAAGTVVRHGGGNREVRGPV